MKTQNRKVSFLCPSFNHERFVGDFIRSILKQTMSNWELIIVDDNSADNNIKEIQKITDERIILIKHEFNKGINAALNTALQAATGDFCTFIASDDMLEPDYIMTMLDIFEKHEDINVIYNSLQAMDVNGTLLTNTSYTVPCTSNRFALLHHLFFVGNILPSPGMIMRTKTLHAIFPLDISLCFTQDYYLNIRLLLNNNIYLHKKPLTRYRINTKEHSSTHTAMYTSIIPAEKLILYDTFLKITNMDTLHKIFHSELKTMDIQASETIPFILGRIALRSNSYFLSLWGYTQILNFLRATEHNAKIIYDHYHIEYRDILKFGYSGLTLSKELDSWSLKKIMCYKIKKHLSFITSTKYHKK